MMRWRLALLVIVPLALGWGIVHAQTEEMVLVFSIKTDDGVVEYQVSQTRFGAATNAWDVSDGDFPVDIGAFSERAKQYLIKKKGAPETVVLHSVSMSLRGQRFMKTEEGRVKLGPWMRCWALAFRFEQPSILGRPLPLPVVMLLDGTIVEEKLVSR